MFVIFDTSILKMKAKFYSCLIRNVPLIEKPFIERYFKIESRQFGDVHSIVVEYDHIQNANQCCINYLDENSMKIEILTIK